MLPQSAKWVTHHTQCRLGIDCVSQIIWRGWAPGGEYHRTLNVRNVTTRTITLRYKLPKSKAFSMDFPEPIQLRAGLSHALRISFRPIRSEQQQDEVSFECAEGRFAVSVAALLPSVQLDLPQQLDFGLTPVSEVCSFAPSCTSTLRRMGRTKPSLSGTTSQQSSLPNSV